MQQKYWQNQKHARNITEEKLVLKADMHIHSTISDGSYTMEEIVAAAEKKGLDAIAITDHDTLSHALKLPKSSKVKVCAGIEISAFDYDKNFRVHVLGFGIKRPEIVEKVVHPTLEARNDNSMKQIQILRENGYDIDIDCIAKADGKYIYKQHIMDWLLAQGKVPELFGDFYYSTFKNNGICHFDIEYLNPFTAIKAIKDAGGYAVLAHSGQQQNFELIPELVKAGLDGLELNHHANADKDKVIIREYADKYHLFLTGGSDCHGRYEPNSPEVGDYLAEQSGAEILFLGS